MSEQAYCSGKNTGCDHEDKPTVRECSDCPYMSTIRPINEQDELLYEIEAIFYRHTETLTCGYMGLRCDENQSGDDNYKVIIKEILAKAKQHYEQKRLDRPRLLDLYCKWCPREQECDENLALEEKRGCVACGGFVDELKALIPDIEEADALREIIAYLEAKVKEAKKQGCDETIQRVIDMPHATTHCDIIKTLKGVTDDKKT